MNTRFNEIATVQDLLAGRATLKIGERSEVVAAIQEALLDMGFPMMALKNGVATSAVDGVFGSQTATALRNFQIHARKNHSSVAVTGMVDTATMDALIDLAPERGRKAWDAGQPVHVPATGWRDDPSIRLRIVVVKDEHRTFLFDPGGRCIGIFPNAHGTADSGTDEGLKKIRTKLGESQARAVGREKWNSDKAFGKRILDLSWASGVSHGEELHGTYDYVNMGRDVSHGCVRHYNEDIIAIFDAVNVGDYVAIVRSIDDPSLGRVRE